MASPILRGRDRFEELFRLILTVSLGSCTGSHQLTCRAARGGSGDSMPNLSDRLQRLDRTDFHKPEFFSGQLCSFLFRQ